MGLEDRVLFVDKPRGVTSFGVVRQIRKAARVAKIGHCGSLDPLATGLLAICTGLATRVTGILMDQPKEYLGRVRFGRATDSYDADGRTVSERAVESLPLDALRTALRGLEGEIEQRPPMVSAVKHAGERLYEIARRGEEVERAPRRVVVHAIEMVDHGADYADLRIRCGRGCYVRSIAHDLGERLGIPSHLEALRRTALGGVRVEDALRLDALLEALVRGEPPARGVQSLPAALGFLPALSARPGFEAALRHGTQPGLKNLREAPRQPGLHRLFDASGRSLLALVRVERADGLAAMRLECVFARPLEAGAETDPP
jgi:tRNA pseudouridine55 synthase